MKTLQSPDGEITLSNFVPNYIDNMVRYDYTDSEGTTGKLQYITDLWEGFNPALPIVENDHCLAKIHALSQYQDFVVIE